jgi:16S rRNA (cytidine1402-2'-O)-methyltransferase
MAQGVSTGDESGYPSEGECLEGAPSRTISAAVATAIRVIGMDNIRGRLYVVATPLGNLEDLAPRAVRILRQVALIACEDTRRTATLLRAHGITTPTTSYFEHNERSKGERILGELARGRDVALVTDAGTPAISDPGFRLVRDARAVGIPVLPIPGPSAAVTALSVSGLPCDRFLFVGFPPAREGARKRFALELRERRETIVLYESPLRIVALLAELNDVWGQREAFLAREVTKLHEEYLRGSLAELQTALAARPRLKGEITLVVAGAPEDQPAQDEAPEAAFARLVAAGHSRRSAAKQVARLSGLPAREIYRRMLDEVDAKGR